MKTFLRIAPHMCLRNVVARMRSILLVLVAFPYIGVSFHVLPNLHIGYICTIFPPADRGVLGRYTCGRWGTVGFCRDCRM